jgi:hypothetical protein
MTPQDLHDIFMTESDHELIGLLMLELSEFTLAKRPQDYVEINLIVDNEEHDIIAPTLLEALCQAISIQGPQ